ncbi:MAG: hypothetical protein J4F46_05110 [Dehalococcoidia bacterium]|nr:hypothetical protein [Dehalococcoidia bacterium]
MRGAAVVVGILAAIIMFVGAMIALIIGSATSEDLDVQGLRGIAELADTMRMDEKDFFNEENLNRLQGVGLLGVLFSIVGLAGAALAVFKQRTGAVVMGVGAIVSLITIIGGYTLAPVLIVFGVLAMLLFLAAAFFSLKSRKGGGRSTTATRPRPSSSQARAR